LLCIGQTCRFASLLTSPTENWEENRRQNGYDSYDDEKLNERKSSSFHFFTSSPFGFNNIILNHFYKTRKGFFNVHLFTNCSRLSVLVQQIFLGFVNDFPHLRQFLFPPLGFLVAFHQFLHLTLRLFQYPFLRLYTIPPASFKDMGKPKRRTKMLVAFRLLRI
jgi:hypothetical protein